MSTQTRLEQLQEYHAEKIATGRKDPIAKMLIGRIEREIQETEVKLGKELRNKSAKHTSPRGLIQSIGKALYRLWDHKDRSRFVLHPLLKVARPENTGAAK